MPAQKEISEFSSQKYFLKFAEAALAVVANKISKPNIILEIT